MRPMAAAGYVCVGDDIGSLRCGSSRWNNRKERPKKLSFALPVHWDSCLAYDISHVLYLAYTTNGTLSTLVCGPCSLSK